MTGRPSAKTKEGRDERGGVCQEQGGKRVWGQGRLVVKGKGSGRYNRRYGWQVRIRLAA